MWRRPPPTSQDQPSSYKQACRNRTDWPLPVWAPLPLHARRRGRGTLTTSARRPAATCASSKALSSQWHRADATLGAARAATERGEQKQQQQQQQQGWAQHRRSSSCGSATSDETASEPQPAHASMLHRLPTVLQNGGAASLPLPGQLPLPSPHAETPPHAVLLPHAQLPPGPRMSCRTPAPPPQHHCAPNRACPRSRAAAATRRRRAASVQHVAGRTPTNLTSPTSSHLPSALPSALPSGPPPHLPPHTRPHGLPSSRRPLCPHPFRRSSPAATQLGPLPPALLPAAQTTSTAPRHARRLRPSELRRRRL